MLRAERASNDEITDACKNYFDMEAFSQNGIL